MIVEIVVPIEKEGSVFDNYEGTSISICLNNFSTLETNSDFSLLLDSIDSKVLIAMSQADNIFIDDLLTLKDRNESMFESMISIFSKSKNTLYFITRVKSKNDKPYCRKLLTNCSKRILI